VSRRVLITGGASGLGAALAAGFVERGDQVLITDRAQTFDAPAGMVYRKLDVTSDADWEQARGWVEEAWGGLDILVNNAGIAAGGRIDVIGEDEWRNAIEVNLLGVVRGCHTFVPMFKKQGSGHIVNVASVAGLVYPPAMGSYTATKAGVVALSETLSYELHPYGITTSVVCPSFFRTNLAQSLTGSDKAVEHVAARLIEKSPRTADEIAAAVIRGIEKRRPVIITDRPARQAVWTKQYARPLYDREQRLFAARIKAITDKEA
jgi:NAD(P)-dependent dehydrogenase (short-subunit alcohol dehydrogenase family)